MNFSVSIKKMTPFAIYLFGLLLFFLFDKPPARGEVDYLEKMGVVRLNKSPNAPNFSLPDLDERIRRLKEFHGQLVMLNFWATW